jgi:aspartate aminotransferase-like enzyme
MNTERPIVFKIASEESEFEQVFRLSYRTFVEEIPQHPPNPERRLVDRFHHQNTYLIATEGDQLVGMMAVRDQRPFSLDEKLGNIDPYLPPGRRICEIRLLSVVATHRNGTVFQGMLKLLLEHGRNRKYNLAVISGTVRQQKLYRHLGFVPFARLVGPPEAQFQPMYLTLEEFEESADTLLQNSSAADRALNPVSFLPGPVAIRRDVRLALDQWPISHRAPRFKEELQLVRQELAGLTRAAHLQVLVGSGTLANDVVAGQLALLESPGVVLSNGEFGQRLIDHARRFGLRFDPLELEWGAVFSPEAVREWIGGRPDARWLWVPACETSTGIVNDASWLRELCARAGIRLCLDVISWIGTMPLDLENVFLASATSGKGLGSFPGLAIVFHQDPVLPRPDRLPRYLDLGLWAAEGSVPFTHSSNLVAALRAALRRFEAPRPFEEVTELSSWLRPRLKELGYQILAPEEHATPAVITLALPPSIRGLEVGNHLASVGLLVGYQSEYLLRRNWLQICLMGECSRVNLVPLLSELRRFAPRAPRSQG